MNNEEIDLNAVDELGRPLYVIRKKYYHNESDIEKIRAAALKRTQSQETRDKIAASRRGKPLSQETKDKISKAHLNKRTQP